MQDNLFDETTVYLLIDQITVDRHSIARFPLFSRLILFQCFIPPGPIRILGTDNSSVSVTLSRCRSGSQCKPSKSFDLGWLKSIITQYRFSFLQGNYYTRFLTSC